MDKQNVTVTLPADVLREARHLAVDGGMSLSRFLASLIEERVDWARRYEEARQRQTRLMREAKDRGTSGAIPWTRDDLHDKNATLVVTMEHSKQLRKSQDDACDLTLATARMLTTSPHRHPLNDVLAQFGYTREQLRDLNR